MAVYKNEVIISYPVEEIFRIFKKTAKRDFTKFNDKNPIGTSVTREVGVYGGKKTSMTVTITGYVTNELYEVTSVKNIITYKSRYEFERIDENTTKLKLIEENKSSGGVFEIINNFLALTFYRRKFKKRFQGLIMALEKEIEDVRKRVERSKAKNASKEKGDET